MSIPSSSISLFSSVTSSSASSILSAKHSTVQSKQDESALDSDDFDKDYEYDEVNVVESQKSCKNEDDEEDKFTNDIDLKYDQENSGAHAKEVYFFQESNPKPPSLLDSGNCDKQANKQASVGESAESEPESDEEEEEEDYCSSSSDDTCTDDNDDYSSNLYDYELENDEQMYFDKYECDINSKCCKLYGNNEAGLSYATDFAGLNKLAQPSKAKNFSSLSTSIKSIPDESNLVEEEATTAKPARARSGEGTSSLNTTMSMSAGNVNGQDKAKYKSYSHFVYEKMNRQRLMLVDLLLKNGADKYMLTKLSVANVKRLSKKSLGMLRKWYGVAKPSTDAAANIGETEHVEENESIELRPLSPMMAALCLDDVEIFSRLYKHHQNLFNYFKPDEDYELIYYAIKFQSKNCLIYLLCNTNGDIELPSLLEQHSSKLNTQLSLPLMTAREDSAAESNVTLTPASPSINSDSFSAEFQQRLNKNVNTMFYILENTRSSKIVKVLLKCGFDLCKREPLSGNTALHCLFNGNARTSSSASFAEHKSETRSSARATLDEYHAPHSFSKILFIMLKYGGLKAHVNTLNYEKKLCMQNLFEWNELVDTVFFKDSFKSVHSSLAMKPAATPNRAEWQREFEECLLLLLKSGADLLMLNSGSNNCIETLVASILRNSASEPAHDQFTIYSNASSASLSQNLVANSSSQAWVVIIIIFF